MRVAEHRAADLHAALVGVAHARAPRRGSRARSRLKSSRPLDVGEMRGVEHRLLRAGNALDDVLARAPAWWRGRARRSRPAPAPRSGRAGRAGPCRGWRRSSRHSRPGRSRGSCARMRSTSPGCAARNAGVNQRSTTLSTTASMPPSRHRLDARVPEVARRHADGGVAERQAREAARMVHGEPDAGHAAHREAAIRGLVDLQRVEQVDDVARRAAPACSRRPAPPICRGRAGRSG